VLFRSDLRALEIEIRAVESEVTRIVGAIHEVELRATEGRVRREELAQEAWRTYAVDAEALMLQKGLRITKVVHVRSDSFEKGRVIAQKPEPEDRVGDSLTVLVSSGPHAVLYYCPDFLNKNLEGAQELADKLGLQIETKGTGSLIRSQKPKPGSLVKTGDRITLELREERPNDQSSPVNPVS